MTLIEFFHSECGYCQQQTDVLNEIHSNYSEQIDMFAIGGYNLGSNSDSKNDIANGKNSDYSQFKISEKRRIR